MSCDSSITRRISSSISFAILIERETIDKEQFERLLAGESEDSVFAEPEPPPSEPEPEAEKKPVLKPQPQPRPLPGAAMQPPPDPAAS